MSDATLKCTRSFILDHLEGVYNSDPEKRKACRKRLGFPVESDCEKRKKKTQDHAGAIKEEKVPIDIQ